MEAIVSKDFIFIAFNQQDGCVVSRVQDQVIHTEFVEDDASLREYIKQFHLIGVNTHVVLDPHDYQIIKTGKPSVFKQELKEALVWEIKDQLSAEAKDLVIEPFMCPRYPDQKKVDIFVLSVTKKKLEYRYQFLAKAGLNVLSLGIPELSYAQYLAKYYKENPLVVLLHLRSDYSQSHVFIDGKLIETMRLPNVNLNSTSFEEDLIKQLKPIREQKIKHLGDEILWLVDGEVKFSVELLEQLSAGLNDNVKNLIIDGVEVKEEKLTSTHLHSIVGAKAI